MPVYNSGKYLQVAVDSILTQSLREIELILVDDGSTDGSSECCDEYASKDNRVRVIHQKNCGICYARNVGLDMAQGEYVGFSDHDDEYGINQLEDNYKLIKASNCDLIKFGSREIITVGDKTIKNVVKHLDDRVYLTTDIKNEFWTMWRKNAFDCMWDTLFKRDFLEEHNIRLNAYYKAGGEDFDFLWHCIGQGATMQINSKVYYNHYLRTGFSTSMKYNTYNEKMVLERPEMLLKLIEPLNINIQLKKNEYLYWWLKTVLGSLCHTIAHPLCKLPHSDKIVLIRNLRTRKAYNKVFISIKELVELYKIAPKQYCLLLMFYKLHLYGACLKIYEIKYKMNGIKS